MLQDVGAQLHCNTTLALPSCTITRLQPQPQLSQQHQYPQQWYPPALPQEQPPLNNFSTNAAGLWGVQAQTQVGASCTVCLSRRSCVCTSTVTPVQEAGCFCSSPEIMNSHSHILVTCISEHHFYPSSEQLLHVPFSPGNMIPHHQVSPLRQVCLTSRTMCSGELQLPIQVSNH